MTEDKATTLQVENPNEAIMLLGMADANIKMIEEAFNVHIITRGESIQLTGEEADKTRATDVLNALLQVIRKNSNIDMRDVASAIEMEHKGTLDFFASLYDEEIARSAKGKPIRAKTIGQRE